MRVKLNSFQFNKIAIIESLEIGDSKTGRQVFDDLEFLKTYQPEKLTTEYSEVSKKSEFIRHLKKLIMDAKLNGIFPILHIDAHGNEHGIQFSRNNYIEWHELLDNLSQLNLIMKGNLLVVLASCYGAHIIRHISNTPRAPFWGLIAPYEKTFPDNIYKGLIKFYTSICSEESSAEIVSALNTNSTQNDLKLFTAELLFVKAAEIAVSIFQNKEPLEKRIKIIAQTLSAQGGVFDKTEEQLKSQFVNDQMRKFEADLKKFMLVDLFPENIDKISKLHNPWRAQQATN